MGGKISGEERIVFRTGDGFLRVLLVLGGGNVECDDCGGKFHLRIVAAELNGFVHEGVAIEALRWIRSVLMDPLKLFKGFGEIAEVEESKRRGRRVLRGGIGTRHELDEKVLR